MPPVDDIAAGPNTIRILITTDNHVGFNENDLIRGDDGWKTFQEITYLAKTRDVDMILQGGDLFHVNKPSKKSLYHVMKALRLNCLGYRPCELELLSDPSNLLDGGFNTVNYEDPNINVSVPVFAISGNHDDATGEGFLSPLDLLSVSGLINYFGKIQDNEKITVSPILFQKGTSKLALYGMSNVKDERLHRIFKSGNVKFLRPDVQTDQWFNLLALHQNHFQHSMTSFIPENYLPSFINFVLWGHEHECIPHTSFNPDTGFDTLQPGSSIATSLSEGETAEKYVFILSIQNKEFSIEKVKLQTVRPFVMNEVSLQSEGFVPGPASKDDITKFLILEVERLIEVAKQQYKKDNSELFEDATDGTTDHLVPLPLVRLRVEYSGDYEVENVRRFSNRFVGKIANVNDVIHYYMRKGSKSLTKNVSAEKDKSQLNLVENNKAKQSTIMEYLQEFLGPSDMNLIPEDGITEVITRLIEQDDKQLLNEYVEKSITASAKLLLDIEIDDNEFHDDNEEHARGAFKDVLTAFKRENILNNKILVQYDGESKKLKKDGERTEISDGGNSTDGSNVVLDSTFKAKPSKTKTNSPPSRKTSKRKAAPKSSFVVEDVSNSEDEAVYVDEMNTDVLSNEKYSDQLISLDDNVDDEAPQLSKQGTRSNGSTKGSSSRPTRGSTVGRSRASTRRGSTKSRGKKQIQSQILQSGSLMDDIMNLGK